MRSCPTNPIHDNISLSFPPDPGLFISPISANSSTVKFGADISSTLADSGIILPSSSATSDTWDSVNIPIDFILFRNIPNLMGLLEAAAKRNSCTPAGLCKLSCRYLQSINHDPSSGVSTAPPKPSALYPWEMFDPQNFLCGQNPIPDNELIIKPDVFAKYHIKFCKDCSISNHLLPNCYGHAMYMCLRNGWLPNKTIPDDPIPSYTPPSVTVDHKFYDIIKAQVDKFLSMGAVEQSIPSPGTKFHLTPINVIFKKSDLIRAAKFVKVKVVDTLSLHQVNAELTKLGQPELKPRLVFDFRGSGLNDTLYTMPFSNVDVNDGIGMLEPGDTMAKIDIKSYFSCFPIAKEFRHLMAFSVDSIIFNAASIAFGISLAPAFCSTFSAEFLHWFLSMKIKAVIMTDDLMTAANSYIDAMDNIMLCKSVLNELGFSIADEKDEIGTSISFLGVKIDSVKMKISFSHEKAATAATLVSSFRKNLLANRRAFPPISELHSIAGKLNDFAKVLQGGRLHVRSAWKFLYNIILQSDDYFEIEHNKKSLVDDLQWWFDVFTSWSNNVLSGPEFPIINANTFLSDLSKIWGVRSDASGIFEHGLGFIYGPFSSDNPKYYARIWFSYEDRSSSLVIEITALLDFLERKAHCLPPGTLLIWFTDSMSACWAINKGYCRTEEAFLIASKIFKILDAAQIYIVAFWEHRELNKDADLLTHLSFFLNRSEIEGNLRDKDYQEYRKVYLDKDFSPPKEADSSQVHSVLSIDGPPALPDPGRYPPFISSLFHEQQQGLYQVPADNLIGVKDVLRTRTNPLVGLSGSNSNKRLDKRGSLSRHNSIRSKSSSDSGNSLHDGTEIHPFSHRSDPECNAMDVARWSPTIGGTVESSQSIGYHLEPGPQLIRTDSVQRQDEESGSFSSHPICQSGGPLCSEKPEGLIRHE